MKCKFLLSRLQQVLHDPTPFRELIFEQQGEEQLMMPPKYPHLATMIRWCNVLKAPSLFSLPSSVITVHTGTHKSTILKTTVIIRENQFKVWKNAISMQQRRFQIDADVASDLCNYTGLFFNLFTSQRMFQTHFLSIMNTKKEPLQKKLACF